LHRTASHVAPASRDAPVSVKHPHHRPAPDVESVGLFGLESEKHLKQVLKMAVVLDRLAIRGQTQLSHIAIDKVKAFLKAATRGKPLHTVMLQLRDQVIRIQRWWRLPVTAAIIQH
jgi:hypothetical protein